MNEEMAFLLNQSYSFQKGFQDYIDGVLFDIRFNDEWQKGWKWAKCKRG